MSFRRLTSLEFLTTAGIVVRRPLTASMMSEAEKKYLRTWGIMSLNFIKIDFHDQVNRF